MTVSSVGPVTFSRSDRNHRRFASHGPAGVVMFCASRECFVLSSVLTAAADRRAAASSRSAPVTGPVLHPITRGRSPDRSRRVSDVRFDYIINPWQRQISVPDRNGRLPVLMVWPESDSASPSRLAFYETIDRQGMTQRPLMHSSYARQQLPASWRHTAVNFCCSRRDYDSWTLRGSRAPSVRGVRCRYQLDSPETYA